MVKLILVNQRVCGEGITRVNGARGEGVYYNATGEDIGRRSPKLPGRSVYEKRIDAAPRVGHRTAFP